MDTDELGQFVDPAVAAPLLVLREEEGAVRYTDEVSKRLDCVLIDSCSFAPSTVLYTDKDGEPFEPPALERDEEGWCSSYTSWFLGGSSLLFVVTIIIQTPRQQKARPSNWKGNRQISK